LLGGFAEFEIGRIKQALLLLRIEQAFGRQQLEHFKFVIQDPAVGGRAIAQLALGLGQGDVESFLPGLGAFEQKLQRDRGLAGAWRTLQ
jgi:hypothetical protein